MKWLRAFFEDIEWWRLRPYQPLLARQPGTRDISKHAVAAMTDDGELAVIHTPVGAELTLNVRDLSLPVYATWCDPARGVHTDVGRIAHPGEHEFLTPATRTISW